MPTLECRPITVRPPTFEITECFAEARLPDEIPPRDPILATYTVENRGEERVEEEIVFSVGSESQTETISVGAGETQELSAEVGVEALDPGQYAAQIAAESDPKAPHDCGGVLIKELTTTPPAVSCFLTEEEVVSGRRMDVGFTVENPNDSRLQFDLETTVDGERKDRFRSVAPANGAREGTIPLLFDVPPGQAEVDVSVVAGRLI